MQILITGTPGTGKSTVAKKLAKRLRLKCINEMDFALEKGIGRWSASSNELMVPLGKLKSEISKELKKRKKGVIFEGHMLCEIKLPVDLVVLLRVDPEVLESRLEGKKRKYSDEKILDNMFCEGIDYCRKHAGKRYPKSKVLEIRNEKNIKATMDAIINRVKEGK